MSTDDVAKTSKTRTKHPKPKAKKASKKRRDKKRPGGGGASRSIPGSGSTGDERLPWWRRGWFLVTGSILALGALASAITAILGLVLPDPDLVDKAEITSIDIIAAVPLSEYARRAQSGQVAWRGRTGPDLALVGYSTSTSDSAPATGSASVGATKAPAVEPTDVPAETPSAVPTAPLTGSPSDSVSESPLKSPTGSPLKSPTGSAVQSPTGSPNGSPTGSPNGPPADDPSVVPPGIDIERFRYEDVLAEVGDVAPDLELPGSGEPPSEPVVAMISNMKNDAGKPVPAAEAARRLVNVLGRTRTVKTQNGKRDPLGVIVTANMQLEGLLGRELGVYWEVWTPSGASRLYDRWLDEVRVARIAAERERDAGAVQFWVPMPKRPGSYFIHVIIRDGDKVLFVARSDIFE